MEGPLPKTERMQEVSVGTISSYIMQGTLSQTHPTYLLQQSIVTTVSPQVLIDHIYFHRSLAVDLIVSPLLVSGCFSPSPADGVMNDVHGRGRRADRACSIAKDDSL